MDAFPVESYNGKLILEFVEYRFGECVHDIEKCEEGELTYSLPFYAKLRLNKKEVGEVTQQEVYLGDFPLMSAR